MNSIKANLFLAITEKCNLDCTYCNVHKNRVSMDINTLKSSLIYFIRKFIDRNWYNIFFIWWEPLIEFNNIKKAVVLIKNLERKLWKQFSIYIATNWTLLTEDILTFFKLNNVTISISIDSLEEKYNQRNFIQANTSSVPIINNIISLLRNYNEIIRVKMVVTPETVEKMVENHSSIWNHWFNFINVQPAHWIYWSDENINKYLNNYNLIKDKVINNRTSLSATFKWNESSYTSKQSTCAKWKDEIMVDNLWNVYVCDAFLAFNNSERWKYAHWNIHNKIDDLNKLSTYTNWKYCNNTILWKEKDIIWCENCNETISCSKICNAIPINWKGLDINIIKSNFKLFKAIDEL